MNTIHNSLVKKTLIKVISVITFITSSALYAQSPTHNNDPLSLAEVSKVVALTAGSKVAARGLNGSDLSTITNNSQEILLIERNEEKGAPSDQRRADVFIYDYSSNELIQSLVDLNTSKVIRSERRQGVQLPLTENELNRAKQIIFEDEDERTIIEQEFRRITSQDLTDIAALNMKAFIFHADSLPNRTNEASKQCGVQRCAQVIMYTQDSVVFEISLIVNLSEGVVTQRIGF